MEIDQQLLKTQQNRILDILVKIGLKPTDFRWFSKFSQRGLEALAEHIRVSVIEHNNEPFYFLFDNYDFNTYVAEYSPGDKLRTEEVAMRDWEGQLALVIDWAKNVKKELNAPDLWHELEKYQGSFSIATDPSIVNQQIPDYEIDKISESLKLLGDRIHEQYSLTPEQNHFVHSRLDYLAGASKRQGRLDWVHTAIGVFFTI